VSNRLRLSYNIRRDRGKQTPVPRIISVTLGEIPAHDAVQALLEWRIQPAVPPVPLIRAHACFGGQRLLGLEVSLEAAVRHACGLHDLADRDAIEAVSAEQLAGHIKDLFAALASASSISIRLTSPPLYAASEFSLARANDDSPWVTRHVRLRS
jgi:hypothetical protein